MKYKSTWYRCVLILLAIFTFQNTYAQDKIESERADQGNDAHALEKKEFQVEGGIIFNRFDTGAHALIGEMMLRYGLLEGLELRLLMEEGKERDRFVEETVQGFYPLALGAKVVLLEHRKSLPDIALSGYVKLPFTAHTKEQSIYWSKTLTAIFEKELYNKKWDFLANIGIQQQAFSKDYQWQAVGIVKYEGLENLNISGEYFANYQAQEMPQHNVGFVLSYSLSKDFELDLSAGASVFSDEPNQFVSIGFAARLPH